MIYINSRFPRTPKQYEKAADDNLDRLLATMKDITIKERIPSKKEAKPALKPTPTPRGGSAWSYGEKKKAKTFKL